MKHVGKKLLALLLVLSMLSGMSFNNVTIASAEETTAACITLSKNVKSEVEDTTYIYNGYKPNLGAKFTGSVSFSQPDITKNRLHNIRRYPILFIFIANN